MSAPELIAAIEEALSGMAIPGLCFTAAEIAAVRYHPSGAEYAYLAGVGVHRRKEFIAGRYCAKQALQQLNCSVESLLPDAEGLPIWPEGYAGSITHSKGLALAGVAPASELAYLGLDLERTDRLSPAAIERVLHPDERDAVGQDQSKASIYFSLKEAFYKAQYPRWHTPGNFQEIALEVDRATGTAYITKMEPHFAPELAQLHCRFAVCGAYVLSACWRSF